MLIFEPWLLTSHYLIGTYLNDCIAWVWNSWLCVESCLCPEELLYLWPQCRTECSQCEIWWGRGAGRQHSSSVPLAVPGEARLPLLGQSSVHMRRLSKILPQLLPALAKSCVLPSICSTVSGSYDSSRLILQGLCLSLLSFPSSFGQELLNNFDFVFSVVGGRLRLVPVTAIHRSQRDWSVFLCLLSKTGHVSPKHY